MYVNDWTFRLSFHRTWDLHVYIHSPGDEIWLSFLAFPFQLVYFRLNSNNSDGIKTTDVTISENEIVTLDKEGSTCKSYMEKARLNNFSNLVLVKGIILQILHLCNYKILNLIIDL